MSSGRILIACIGNIFFGDDAFGVEVARELAQRPQPDAVQVVDFGIRGLDLTYALLDDYEAVILVDAVRRGGAPGTLYVLEPQLPETPLASDAPGMTIDPHSLDPQKVLQTARAMGGKLERILLVGCEPSPPASEDDMQMELSAPVRAAVREAVSMVESLVSRLRETDPARPIESR